MKLFKQIFCRHKEKEICGGDDIKNTTTYMCLRCGKQFEYSGGHNNTAN